jgi:hypothetical protein
LEDPSPFELNIKELEATMASRKWGNRSLKRYSKTTQIPANLDSEFAHEVVGDFDGPGPAQI